MRIRELFEAPEVVDRPPVHQQQEVPLHVPGGATVVILNDPVTPFEVVVEAVMHGTGLSADETIRRVNHSHREGWSPVASYASVDMAETVASRIEQHARGNTRYDRYRPHIPHQGRQGFNGPWPLACEVMDADQAR
jgi:ATP-dependent Clp protease adapter protein ClpS